MTPTATTAGPRRVKANRAVTSAHAVSTVLVHSRPPVLVDHRGDDKKERDES